MTARAKGIIIVLLLVVMALFVIATREYMVIQKNKIESLNTAFYYMQEIIVDEELDDFKNWERKAENLYIINERAASNQEGMGDYKEIYTMIEAVSQIEDPSKGKSESLLSKAKQMRVSWVTENWKWKANIIDK